MSSSEAASTRGTSNAREERAALEGMLRGYPVEQLVEEVMTAWEELAERNDEVVEAKQRLRVMELDLADVLTKSLLKSSGSRKSSRSQAMHKPASFTSSVCWKMREKKRPCTQRPPLQRSASVVQRSGTARCAL